MMNEYVNDEIPRHSKEIPVPIQRLVFNMVDWADSISIV